MFTDRQEDIINKLLHHAGPVHQQLLSHELAISERTLRKDLAEINDALAASGCSIRHQRNHGYYIAGEDRKAIKAMILKNEKYSEFLPQNDYQRKMYILFTLLWASHPVSLNRISEDIFVSKTTVYNDFQSIRQRLLQDFQISLHVSKSNGYRLDCDEVMKRRILSKVIADHKKRYKYLMKMFVKYDIYYHDQYTQLIDVIYQWAKENGIMVSTMDVINFALEIQICYRRFRDGFCISGYLEQPKVQHFPLEEINRIMQTELSKTEADYLLSTLNHKAFLIPYLPKKLDDFKQITQDILQMIDAVMGKPMLFSQAEIQDFEIFLSSLVKSLSNQIHQEMITELVVHQAYPFYYELAYNMQPILSKHTDYVLTSGDQEHITLYLVSMIQYRKRQIKVMIISDYTNILLKLFLKKLTYFFGQQLDIIGVVDTKAWGKRAVQSDFDLAISTNLLPPDAAVCYVDITLEENDIVKLFHVLHERSV